MSNLAINKKLNSPSTRIDSIDFIRAISFLMIVASHFVGELSQNGVDYPYFHKYYLGGIGVAFFIITSGASLYISTKNKFDLKIYIKKRIANIYPYFWICYIFVAVFLFLSFSTVCLGNDPVRLLITFLALDGYLNSTVPNTYYLIGEWFTGFILLVYILFPFVFWLKNKNIYIATTIIIISSFIAIQNTPYIIEHFFLWNKDPFWNPISRLPEILLGTMVIDLLLLKNKTANFFVAFVALLYIVIVITFIENHYMAYNMWGISMWAMTYVIISCLYENITIPNAVKKIILFLSEYSFVAFLLHHQLIGYLVSKIQFHEFNRFQFFYFYVVIVFLCYVLAYLIKPIGDKLKAKILKF
ncbi:acyltransferase family protein [Snodgrassella gandavensis]|uniref:acyltransferase family protein n=1 Tax=Snodgrassella gandavensis TaxID=2946698 RepID=UPI001EF5AB56|nr:acyltransferase family protein [Snodgrassella gandavensis]